MWGTTRTLIFNAVMGMTEGYTVPVYLVGVGYRAAIEPDPRGTTEGNSGQRLNMKLGFSHAVFVPIPAHIKAEVPLPTKIVLSCTDKSQLGQFAANVRGWRPPEPYKGKVSDLILTHAACSQPAACARVFLSETSKFESKQSRRSRALVEGATFSLGYPYGVECGFTI